MSNEQKEIIIRMPNGMGLFGIRKDERYTSLYFIGFDERKPNEGITVTPKELAVLYSAMNVDAQSRVETEILTMRKKAIEPK